MPISCVLVALVLGFWWWFFVSTALGFVCRFLGFPFAVVSVVWVLLLFGLVTVGVVCDGFLGGGCVCVCVGVRGLVVLKFDVFW